MNHWFSPRYLDLYVWPLHVHGNIERPHYFESAVYKLCVQLFLSAEAELFLSLQKSKFCFLFSVLSLCFSMLLKPSFTLRICFMVRSCSSLFPPCFEDKFGACSRKVIVFSHPFHSWRYCTGP